MGLASEKEKMRSAKTKITLLFCWPSIKSVIAIAISLLFGSCCMAQGEGNLEMLKITWVSTGRSLVRSGDGPSVEEFVLIFTGENTAIWFHDNNGETSRTGRERVPLESKKKIMKTIREVKYPAVEFPTFYSAYFQISFSSIDDKQILKSTKLANRDDIDNVISQLRPLFIGGEAPLSSFRDSCKDKIHPWTGLGSLLLFRSERPTTVP